MNEMLKRTRMVFDYVMACKREIGETAYEARLANVLERMKDTFTVGKLKKVLRMLSTSNTSHRQKKGRAVSTIRQ